MGYEAVVHQVNTGAYRVTWRSYYLGEFGPRELAKQAADEVTRKLHERDDVSADEWQALKLKYKELRSEWRKNAQPIEAEPMTKAVKVAAVAVAAADDAFGGLVGKAREASAEYVDAKNAARKAAQLAESARVKAMEAWEKVDNEIAAMKAVVAE